MYNSKFGRRPVTISGSGGEIIQGGPLFSAKIGSVQKELSFKCGFSMEYVEKIAQVGEFI